MSEPDICGEDAAPPDDKLSNLEREKIELFAQTLAKALVAEWYHASERQEELIRKGFDVRRITP